jgi:hypothetical protein
VAILTLVAVVVYLPWYSSRGTVERTLSIERALRWKRGDDGLAFIVDFIRIYLHSSTTTLPSRSLDLRSLVGLSAAAEAATAIPSLQTLHW